MNFFEFFGLEMAFRIDENALRRAFLANSKKWHPDRFGLASEAEREQVLELSTRNNEAFKTLADEALRIEYVLRQKGFLTADERQNEQLPPDFLMEMMDLNEELADLAFDENAEKLAAAEANIDALEAALKKDAEPFLATWTASDPRPEPLAAAKDFFLKRKYLLRLRNRISTFAAPLEERL